LLFLKMEILFRSRGIFKICFDKTLTIRLIKIQMKKSVLKASGRLIIMLFFVSPIQMHSQSYNSLNNDQEVLDSLTVAFYSAKTDSLKCITGFKLAGVYFKNNNLLKYRLFLTKANGLIKNNTYLKDISFYYNAIQHLPLSSDEKGMGNFRQNYERASLRLAKYKTPEIYSIRSTILFNLALVYQRQNLDLKAIKILINEAIPLAEKANDNIEKANIYRFLGLIFYNSNDLLKAAQYVQLAIETLENKKIKRESYDEDLLQFYLFYVEILSQQNKLSVAKIYLRKAKLILDDHPYSNMLNEYYLAEGAFEHQNKHYEKAIFIFDKGITNAIRDSDSYVLINFKLLKFESLKNLEKYQEARDLLLEVFRDKAVNIEDKKNYSKALSQVFKKLNDFPNALKYSEQYILLNDSLSTVSKENEIAAIESKFKNKENENRIKALEIQRQKSLLTESNNRLSIFTFCLISITLLLTIVFLFKNSKNQKRLAIQKEINHAQTLTSFQTKKKLEVMQAMIDGEEAERKRIARDLHDGIGSRLSALKMQLQSIPANKTLPGESDNFLLLLSQSILELREISFNLMPETLNKLGLELALRDLCHSLSNESMAVEFHANGINKRINPKDQITIFRIVQELINNALKHSDCSEIIIDCSQNRDLFLITVEDNGKGFNWNECTDYNGLGLKNIKTRIELLKGKLEVHSKVGKGSVFNIDLYVTLDEL